MVDEAHGGHFYFNPDYPPTALAGGADVVINGLHKTLPVLTQGACLHIGNTCPNPDRFVQARSLLTTTSPSYLIMASIDLARDWMDRYGREALERALCLSHEYRQKINRIKGIRCLSHELLLTGVEALDPLKMLISVDELAEDGIVLAKRLSDEWNIEVEWKSRDIILAMMSIFHDKEDWQRLYEALYHISRRWDVKARESKPLSRHCLSRKYKSVPGRLISRAKPQYPSKIVSERSPGKWWCPTPLEYPVCCRENKYLQRFICTWMNCSGRATISRDWMLIRAK